ncbi:MAG: acyl-ACP--UDP-N-acetylglucosamine O-acyltransferase [Phycisphaerae bacterium]
MPKIHPMAVVESGARLADDVVVGAFAYVGPQVVLGKGCVLHHHAQVEGRTVAGENNEFFPNCLVGAVSQDLKYRGGACRVVIGNNNVIRENTTIHIGTEDGGGETVIGNDNLIMVGAHIAHDCVIGNDVILANNVLLAGHVLVEDHVVISGGAASHHYVRFGQHSFVGGLTGVTRDVPPFMVFDGTPGIVRGINRNGLKRRGFNEEQLGALKMGYRLLFSDTTPLVKQAVELEKMYPGQREIEILLKFMREAASGKFGRYRENLRGKSQWHEDDETPPHVSGN